MSLENAGDRWLRRSLLSIISSNLLMSINTIYCFGMCRVWFSLQKDCVHILLYISIFVVWFYKRECNFSFCFFSFVTYEVILKYLICKRNVWILVYYRNRRVAENIRYIYLFYISTLKVLKGASLNQRFL